MFSGIGPRPVLEYRILMSARQLQNAQWILMAGMPGSMLLLGALVWLRRRK
jgi:LPXTG-motif cell wall-anchored protein